jgi:glycerol-3-phosphate acyltransferase PlsY
MNPAYLLLHSIWEALGMGVWVPAMLGYLLGSIPFGYLLVKFGHGQDIRQSGSGNIGAANVTRTVGKGAGVATLILDALKGTVAVWLGRWIAPEAFETTPPMMIAGLFAIVGHFFPVWLKFKGGKGVATGVGVFLPICWEAVAGAFMIWLATVAATRYVSLGSMLASGALPVLIYFMYAPGFAPPLAIIFGSVIAAAGIIWKHHENVARLVAGTEPKLKL